MSNEEKILELLQGLNTKVDRLEGRLDKLEDRFDKLEDRFDKLEDRFDKLEDRFDKLEAKVNKLQTSVDQLTEEHMVTREALNRLIEWSDKVSEAVDFPLPRS